MIKLKIPEKLKIEIDEGDRQLILLAIAELALSRPGWDDTLSRIATNLSGKDMFEEFKKLNADRVKFSHGPLSRI